MNNSLSQHVKGIREEFAKYIELRLKYSKLIAFEKIAKLIASSSSILILAFFGFFGFFFLSFALGYYLGEVLGSLALGFTLVAFMYLLIIAILAVNRKKFENIISEKIIEALLEEDKLEDDENKF
jgi:hypothetical protein